VSVFIIIGVLCGDCVVLIRLSYMGFMISLINKVGTHPEDEGGSLVANGEQIYKCRCCVVTNEWIIWLG